MSIDRRDFVRLSALTGGAAALGYPSALLAKEGGSTEPYPTLEWVESWPEERKGAPLRFGISPEREAEVLETWHASMG